MRPASVHIIGAGLAGLSAAVGLASRGANIFVHEAAKSAGGRCRSYFDPHLGMEIDNGNHLLLSGNTCALRYVKIIGAENSLARAPEARFPFVDLRNGRRWTIAPSDGILPFWLLSRERRAPNTGLSHHLDILKLMWASGDAPIAQRMACEGPLYDHLMRPLLLAALNTDPAIASSALARQVMRETLAKGAQACRPIIAQAGLSKAFIDPALAYLAKRNINVAFAARLRGIAFDGARARALQFENRSIELSPGDLVILAVPPQIAGGLIPGLSTPDAFNAIVNAHFAIAPPPSAPLIMGMIGAASEWLIAYRDRLSVTISAANHLLDQPVEELARTIWSDVAQVTGLREPMPRWRIIREKRATFAATPEQNRKRPGTLTRYSNLLLAGDWTATGLPATIEGAIKSGDMAALQALQMIDRSNTAPRPARIASWRQG